MTANPGDTLIEHGLEFVLDAVRLLDEHAGEEREARFAVVHLAIGAELIHKGRLFRHDWRQVFIQPDAANPIALASGDFKSVGPEDCVKRLETCCRIILDQPTKDVHKELGKLRNKVVHFAMPLSEGASRTQAAKVLAVLVDFIDRHAAIEPGSTEDGYRDEILARLASLEDWVNARRAAIKPQIDALGDEAYVCPVCTEDALEVQENRRCLFCLSEVEPGEAARQHAMSKLGWNAYDAGNNGWDPFATCPQCREAIFVRVTSSGRARKCFTCGVRYNEDELAGCTACGKFFRPTTEDDDVICPACFDDRVGAE